MLHLAINESYFSSKKLLWKQVDGVAMGSEFETEIEFKNNVGMSRENGRFKTTVYRKPTFSSSYTYFDGFLPMSFKFSMS